MKKTAKILLVALLFVYVLSCLILASCSPIKRLERFQKRHPYLFVHRVDTLLIRDTIKFTIPGTKIDTAVPVASLRDTIVITKDNIRTVVYQHNDSVFITTTADTVVKLVPFEKQVTISNKEPYRKPRDGLSFWEALLLASILSVILVCLFLLVMKLSSRSR